MEQKAYQYHELQNDSFCEHCGRWFTVGTTVRGRVTTDHVVEASGFFKSQFHAACNPPCSAELSKARGPASGSPSKADSIEEWDSCLRLWGTTTWGSGFDGEWVDAPIAKSPRTIAEAKAASASPRYYDKHGTEIFEGDECTDDRSGLTGKAVLRVAGVPECAKHVTVLSRADGTPVYRYKDGRDVQIGDTYLVDGYPKTESRPVTEYRMRDTAISWSRVCTLIRRAGVEPRIEDYAVTQKPTKQISTWSPEVHEFERFADWCNQPTLAQRFEAYKLQLANAIASLPGDIRSRISTLTDLVAGTGGKWGTKRYTHQVLTSIRLDDGPWYELGAFPLGGRNDHVFATIDSAIKYLAVDRLRKGPRGPASPGRKK